MVECMTFEALNGEKTGAVVGAPRTPRTGVSQAVKWLVCLVLAMMCALWITPYALAEGEGTLTENITDPQNLLGSNTSSVSDKIKETKEQTGATVRLLYVESFGTEVKPVEWATGVLESLSPKPNTVLLAVASGDGKLVVVASSNSDEWLRNKKTVEALSEAATDKLAKSGAQDWSGAAIAMMDEIMLLKKTSTSSSLTVVGIIGLICAVALLIVGAVLIVLRNRKRHKEAELDAKRAAAGKRTRANRRRHAGEPAGGSSGKERKRGEKRKGGSAHGNRHGHKGRRDKKAADQAAENTAETLTGTSAETGGLTGGLIDGLTDEARNDAVAGAVVGVVEAVTGAAESAGDAVETATELAAQTAAKNRRKRKRRGDEDEGGESVDVRSVQSAELDESEPRFHAGDSFMPGDGSVDQSVSDDIEAMFAKPFIPGTRRIEGNNDNDGGNGGFRDD